MTLKSSLLALVVVACGGASTPVQNPQTEPQPVDAGGSADAAAMTASVVRFDDLGLSFAVPSGFHVVGDDELSARIRAAANPHLQADLRKHASEKKGIPLLTLTQADVQDPLNLTLSVVVVPADATALELLTHEQTVMSENLSAFETTSGPKDLMLDGVAGVEMTTHYTDRSHVRAASRLRLYVRNGLATLVVTVWPEAASGRADEATRLLDGLHFFASP
jgi:hypothetical protein